MCVKLPLLCLALCDPMNYSSPGSSVRESLQAKILEWVATPFSRDLLDPGLQAVSLMSLALTGRFFTTSATWEVQYQVYSKVIQLHMDISVSFPFFVITKY